MVMHGGRRGLAVHLDKAGLLLLLLVTGVTEEHQLAVVFPLWKVKVLRTAGFVGADCLVFTLEDGPQVPELRLYVLH